MKHFFLLCCTTIFILAILMEPAKIEFPESQEKKVKLDTSDIRGFTEMLDWKTYHNDSVDGMHVISYFARNENDSTEIAEMKVERKVANDDQEDISFIMPASVSPETGIRVLFLNQNIINGKDSVDFDQEASQFIPLNELEDKSSIAFVPKGRFKDEKGKEINLLSKCCTFNHVMVIFEYRDGNQKSILIPLMSFKEKYKELE
ncbi:MAG: hypothetical protein RL516_1960 [Bacteroidota bacterium]|jgi:hypothetical protein